MKKVLAGEPTLGFENAVIAHDGTERIFSWNVDRLLDSRGQPVGTIAVGHDITERKLAEEAIRETKEFYERLVGEAGDSIITLDRKGTILTWNTGAERIFGWAAQEAIGRLPMTMTLLISLMAMFATTLSSVAKRAASL